MGCGAAEATGLGFVCFVVLNPCVFSANRVDLGFFVLNIPIFHPPPQESGFRNFDRRTNCQKNENVWKWKASPFLERRPGQTGTVRGGKQEDHSEDRMVKLHICEEGNCFLVWKRKNSEDKKGGGGVSWLQLKIIYFSELQNSTTCYKRWGWDDTPKRNRYSLIFNISPVWEKLLWLIE